MGVDPQKVILISGLESSFIANNVSESGATGLGQFTNGTFMDRIKASKHPELQALKGKSRSEILSYRSNPRIASLALAEHIKDAEERVKKSFRANGINSPVTLADIYTVHNIGNPSMAVAARREQLAIAGVSVKALKLNSGLYKKGLNTTAREYMETVDRKFKILDTKLKNGN
ncbi:transglycosylase [Acinetobacter baumannii]|nr:transglycosylase [Acinetobacter baumannii]KJG90472.1 lytic murein transglycosylase [Acinetobacter baumannii]KPA49031.1 transglycosylase [Acinetobacter baumannii]OHW28645.1 transglycosylase [Acinetobacter baumannii]OIB65654.1 transglycosylase [Acinetobacter baumannii]